MPVFEITAPDGGVYDVEGPDEAGALAALKKMSAQQPDTLTDVAKSAGSGVVRGAAMIAGTGGDISKAAGAGLNVMEAAGVPVQESRKSMLDTMPGWLRKYHETPTTTIGSKEIMGAIDRGVNAPITSYEPQTTEGKYARTVGEFVPAALMGGGGLVRGALAPGVASEAFGQLARALMPKAEGPAKVGGAVVGSLIPSLLRRGITPLPTSPERSAAANTLRAEGVTDITAGQATGRKGLQYLEAERGAGQALGESASEQFTAAALRRVGETANRATPEVVDRAFNRIGGEFDRLAAGNVARVDQQLANDVRASVDDYFNLVSAPNRTPAVANYVQEMINSARQHGGNLPGEVYQSLRSRMERTARSMGNNPEARTAVRELREALDDAMERSITAAGNPADIAAWQQARQQYRNLLVIEKAAVGAGENAALGLISPAKLREATVSTQGKRNYARGTGDYADLARAGNAIMAPLPNSGTPGRMAAQNIGMGTSAMVGALLGGSGGSALGPAGAGIGGAMGAAAGAAMPHLVGRAATSGLGRRYLSNQLMPGHNVDPRRAAIISALTAVRP